MMPKHTPSHRKIRKVMGEFKRGKLRSSSGKAVKSRKQATAIALSEARRLGQKRKKKRAASFGFGGSS